MLIDCPETAGLTNLTPLQRQLLDLLDVPTHAYQTH